MNNIVDGQLQLAMQCHVARRVAQVTTHQRMTMRLGPRAVAMLCNDLELARDPIVFGIDQRAIHVPQDCGQRRMQIGHC